MFLILALITNGDLDNAQSFTDVLKTISGVLAGVVSAFAAVYLIQNKARFTDKDTIITDLRSQLNAKDLVIAARDVTIKEQNTYIRDTAISVTKVLSDNTNVIASLVKHSDKNLELVEVVKTTTSDTNKIINDIQKKLLND